VRLEDELVGELSSTERCVTALNSPVPASQAPVHVHVYLDGQPIDDKVATQIDSAVNAIADSYGRQRG